MFKRVYFISCFRDDAACIASLNEQFLSFCFISLKIFFTNMFHFDGALLLFDFFGDDFMEGDIFIDLPPRRLRL